MRAFLAGRNFRREDEANEAPTTSKYFRSICGLTISQLNNYFYLFSRTKRMNCPAFISLRASKCGQYLQVMQVCNQHNHEISENAIKRTPHYRKLTPEVKEEVLHLMTTNIHRNEIIKYVQLRAGIELISKTINNFMLELKAHKKYVTHVAVFERIQRFLEMNKAVLAIDTSHHEDVPLIEAKEEMVNTGSTDNDLEPYIDSLIEEEYEPMMEFDSTIEFTEDKYEAKHTVDGDKLPDDIIESIQQPPDSLEDKQTRDENRCENCRIAKSGKLLQSEIRMLRLLKRRLIRETTTLKRKKQKLMNQIHQLE